MSLVLATLPYNTVATLPCKIQKSYSLAIYTTIILYWVAHALAQT